MNPRWQRMAAELRSSARDDADHWVLRQLAVVQRLPRWLAGSVMIGAAALGVVAAATDSFLVRLFMRLDNDRFFAALAAFAFTMLPFLVGLYVVALFLPRRPANQLPSAKLRG